MAEITRIVLAASLAGAYAYYGWGPKDHINIRIHILVLRPKTRGIPEAVVCRILMLMWSWAPIFGSVESQKPRRRAWGLGLPGAL